MLLFLIMKNRNKKIALYTSLLSLTGFAFSSLALSCSCGGEKANTFATTYIKNNFDKNTKTLDLSNTNITHIKSGAFSRDLLSNLQNAKSNQIKPGTFSGDTYIKRLILPKTIEYIGKSAFEGLGLEEIQIPENSRLRLIDKSAFNQNRIKTLTFPKLDDDKRELVIKDKAFANNLLSSVTLNDNIKTLENAVFANNELSNFDFKKVEKIKSGALSQNDIENLTLPESIKDISYDFMSHKDENKTINLNILNANLKKKFEEELKNHPDIKKHFNVL